MSLCAAAARVREQRPYSGKPFLGAPSQEVSRGLLSNDRTREWRRPGRSLKVVLGPRKRQVREDDNFKMIGNLSHEKLQTIYDSVDLGR